MVISTSFASCMHKNYEVTAKPEPAESCMSQHRIYKTLFQIIDILQT